MTSTFFDVPLSRLTHVLVALLAITALGAPGRGYAQDSDDERAHTHFTAGRSYFEEGNYEQALAEFQHAYELSHRDVLLVNVANCQERLGQWRDAAQTLDTYLASMAPDAAERGSMERRIQALRDRADQHDAEEAARIASARGTGDTTPPPRPRPRRAARATASWCPRSWLSPSVAPRRSRGASSAGSRSPSRAACRVDAERRGAARRARSARCRGSRRAPTCP